jgi:hypothetical protein
MRDRSKNLLATARREHSRHTLLLAALFMILLAVSVFLGADGLLEYFKLIAGRPVTALEAGAILFLVSAAAFLAVGMSISAEDMAREKAARR